MSNEKLQLYYQLQQVERTESVVRLINDVNNELRQQVRQLLAQAVSIAQVTGFDDLRRGIAWLEEEMKY